MSELLREATRDARLLLGIEQATGVHGAAIQRFRDGTQSPQLGVAGKLAAYFGIESQRVTSKGRSECHCNRAQEILQSG